MELECAQQGASALLHTEDKTQQYYTKFLILIFQFAEYGIRVVEFQSLDQ